MDFLLFTISWMGFNVVLALIPVGTGVLFVKTKAVWVKTLLALIWLAFLPNTIYLLTDPFHFFDDWKRTPLILSALTVPLYIILIAMGVITFIFSLYPLDELLKHKRKNTLRIAVIFFINFLVGIGLTLGRVERINSWELVTNLPKTIHAILAIGTSFELLVTTCVFTLTANLLYFSVENTKLLKKIYRRYFQR